MRYCIVCAWRPIVVKQRCRTCYEHRRRHGHDRTAHLVLTNLRRRIDGMRR